MKIVRIISTTALIINAGTRQGIKKGDILTIMDPKGAPIVDPDTKQKIGILESIKANVVATEVYDNMTIAESEKENSNNFVPDYYKTMKGSTLNGIKKSLGSLAPIPIQKDLNVDPNEIQGLPISKNPIRIGDPVQKRQ